MKSDGRTKNSSLHSSYSRTAQRGKSSHGMSVSLESIWRCWYSLIRKYIHVCHITPFHYPLSALVQLTSKQRTSVRKSDNVMDSKLVRLFGRKEHYKQNFITIVRDSEIQYIRNFNHFAVKVIGAIRRFLFSRNSRYWRNRWSLTARDKERLV